jgi:hypothetical protein
LALKKKAVLASETSVTVGQSSQRNTHEALALVKGIATTITRITVFTVFLGSLCGGRQVGSEEMDSGPLLETATLCSLNGYAVSEEHQQIFDSLLFRFSCGMRLSSSLLNWLPPYICNQLSVG